MTGGAPREPFRPKDLDRLTIDKDGRLYWDGARLRTSRWGTPEYALVAAIVLATVALLSNLDDIGANVGLSVVDKAPASAGSQPTPAAKP